MADAESEYDRLLRLIATMSHTGHAMIFRYTSAEDIATMQRWVDANTALMTWLETIGIAMNVGRDESERGFGG